MPKCRWFRLTPGWLVLMLLAVEAFLILSERFEWFAFNQHKGWTVLVAIASVGATMLLALLWFAVALIFRRPFQFGLRSLLALVVVVAIPCSWLATEMKQARRQQEAVQELFYIPRRCIYSGQTPFNLTWLYDLMGQDLFEDVDAACSCPGYEFTDAEMIHFESLPKLRTLYLRDDHITDAGLEHLKGLSQLEALDLGGTQVTDAGLEHLRGLTQLLYLDLGGTKVTDAGVKRLQQALPKCYIHQ